MCCGLNIHACTVHVHVHVHTLTGYCCVQRSWVGASKKQCEELLEFIRHLAEDDKEGVMAVKVSRTISM